MPRRNGKMIEASLPSPHPDRRLFPHIADSQDLTVNAPIIPSLSRPPFYCMLNKGIWNTRTTHTTTTPSRLVHTRTRAHNVPPKLMIKHLECRLRRAHESDLEQQQQERCLSHRRRRHDPETTQPTTTSWHEGDTAATFSRSTCCVTYYALERAF